MGSNTALEASAQKSAKKSSKKKRKEREANTPVAENIINDKEAINKVDLDEYEPTMAEKLASLNCNNIEATKVMEKQEPPSVQPPSADSVHILLKQAIHADDRTLLLDCLYNQDKKVISNSVSLLSSPDAFKLLTALLSIVQSRGAVLVCALPWLRSLLLQHSSQIMSQESSRVALNSLYQLIESRVSTYGAAVKLSSCVDTLYAGVIDDITDDDEPAGPAIYDDNTESDDDEDDAMETDKEDPEDAEEVEGSSNVSDAEGMSD